MLSDWMLRLRGLFKRAAVEDEINRLRQDVRFSLRSLRATPTVTATAVLSLALGIGANAAIFSIINSLLLRTLPVKDPAQLVLITDTPTHARSWGYRVWLEIHKRQHLFEDSAAWSFTRFDLSSGGQTQFVDGLWVSGSFFEALGVQAALGRTLSARDDERNGGADGPVAVISDRFWRRHFNAAQDVVGQVLHLDGASFTVVGVLPREFLGLEVGRTFDVAVPLADEPLSRGSATYLDAVSTSFLTIVARLRPDQSLDTATTALRQAQREIRDSTIGELRNFGSAVVERYLREPFRLLPAGRGFDGSADFRSRYERPLWTVMAVAGLVLLIACVNVANLLLARATARRHELSLRVALGESRGGLARQLLTESVLLSVAGTVAGVLVATWGSRFLVSQLSASGETVFLDMSIDVRIVMFTVAITVLTTLVFGTAPALRASSATPMDALKVQGRSSGPHAQGRLSSWFVIAQVALSFVLLVAAGLLVQTFREIATRPLGFQPDPVTIVTMNMSRTGTAAEARLPEFERARDAARAVPGVAEAALSFITPFAGGFTPPLNISGVPHFEGRLSGNLISGGWFTAFGTPLIAGRKLTDRDVKGAPRVAVVNQAFTRKFFPGASPLGHTISLYPGGARAMPPMEIVGVVGDAVYSSLRAQVPPTWYAPLAQFDLPEFTQVSFQFQLAVRSQTNSPVASNDVAAAIGRVNPRLALTFRPLSDYVNAARNQERLVALLAGAFGTLGLLLAGLGLYGITAYAVAVRRAEIGIRMALGAVASRIVRLVLVRVAILVASGAVAGTAVSLWLSRFVASLLYGVQPRDTATLLGAFIVLASVGLVAGAIPASKAARTNPVTVLREG